jgi:hypothetical protein
MPGREPSLLLTARMTHVTALGSVLGVPGAQHPLEHGLWSLTGPLRDEREGGWFGTLKREGRKTAYEHAHVLLGPASALTAQACGADIDAGSLARERRPVSKNGSGGRTRGRCVSRGRRIGASEPEPTVAPMRTCTRWRRSWRSATRSMTTSGTSGRCGSVSGSSTGTHGPATGCCPSTMTSSGASAPTTTSTTRTTRSGPSAPPWGTPSSGRACCVCCTPRREWRRRTGSLSRRRPCCEGHCPRGGSTAADGQMYTTRRGLHGAAGAAVAVHHRGTGESWWLRSTAAEGIQAASLAAAQPDSLVLTAEDYKDFRELSLPRVETLDRLR